MQVRADLEMQIHTGPLKFAKRGLRVRWLRFVHIVNIDLISEFVIFIGAISSLVNDFTA